MNVLVVTSFDWGCSELVAPADVRDRHVQVVADLIRANPLQKDVTSRTFTSAELEKAGAPYVDYVFVAPCDETVVGESHTRPGPNAPFLTAKIDQKNQRVPRYRSEMPEANTFWLLLVAGAREAASFWHVIARRHAYPSSFDRTFYLDLYSNQAFELKTVPVAVP